MSEPVVEFQGEYRFLSNFWPAVILLDGLDYPTVEHAYQAAKTNDLDLRLQIRIAPTPASAKRRARQIPLELLRNDWDSIKLDIMRELVKQKFKHGELKKRLLATADRELIEGNTWGDTFWGVCNGKGQNHLGKLLMKIRASLS